MGSSMLVGLPGPASPSLERGCRGSIPQCLGAWLCLRLPASSGQRVAPGKLESHVGLWPRGAGWGAADSPEIIPKGLRPDGHWLRGRHSVKDTWSQTVSM